MINNGGNNELTPSQVDFCIKNIDGFIADEWDVSVAGKAGSDRRFLRIAPVNGDRLSRVIVVWDSSDVDWNRFIAINREISSIMHVLPEIFAVDEKHSLILEEDCGEQTLKDFCSNSNDSEIIEKKYKQTIDVLIHWQEIDVQECQEIASRVLDSKMYLWESDYFAKHCVSEYFGLDSLLTSEWQRERIELARQAAALPLACIHRDFQSENILCMKDEIKLVDYQGARLGAAEYDLASLLYDPYVSALHDSMRFRLVDYYIQKSRRTVTHDTLRIAAMQRLCQALGAYGNLSLHKGKKRYKEYIPIALWNLKGILENDTTYTCLKKVIVQCLERT